MKHKFIESVFISLLLLIVSNSADGAQPEKYTDYIVIFDLSYSMYNEIQVAPSDFINCDSILREKATKGEKAKKVSIGRAAVECYLNNYSHEGDRFAILMIKESSQNGMSVDGFYEEKELICKKMRNEEKKEEGYGLTPLSDALWIAMEFFHKKSSGNRYNKILFVTDLYETKTKEGKDFCETAREIESAYGGELNVDSLLIFVMPIKKVDYDKISKCLRDSFHIATLIPISTFELSFEFIDSIENLKNLINNCEDEKSECEHVSTELEEEIDELVHELPPEDEIPIIYKILLFILLAIGMIFILLGLQFFIKM